MVPKFIPSIVILRLPSVLARRGRSRSSHYADIAAGLFVRPILIGLRATGTPEHEVDTLNAARIAGQSDDEIRALAKQLHAARESQKVVIRTDTCPDGLLPCQPNKRGKA